MRARIPVPSTPFLAPARGRFRRIRPAANWSSFWIDGLLYLAAKTSSPPAGRAVRSKRRLLGVRRAIRPTASRTSGEWTRFKATRHSVQYPCRGLESAASPCDDLFVHAASTAFARRIEGTRKSDWCLLRDSAHSYRLRTMRSSLRRFLSGVCISIAFAMGVSPPRSVVFCLEPSGVFSVELAIGGLCGGCCEHEPASSPAHEQFDEVCGCVDIPLVFVSATRAAKVVYSFAHVEDHGQPSAPPLFDSKTSNHCAVRTDLSQAEHQRPPPLLRLIRSTVLLV
jgi:hypothetical protein